MKASELQPGDVFAYVVLSTAGDYERHARAIGGGRMRLTETGEEFEIKNPGAPVRLIRRDGRVFENTLPNGTKVQLPASFVADRMQQAATHLEALAGLLHNAGLALECGKVNEAKHAIECLASGIDLDSKMREQCRRDAATERLMQD